LPNAGADSNGQQVFSTNNCRLFLEVGEPLLQGFVFIVIVASAKVSLFGVMCA
jgi:hypothetical protein